MMKLLRCEYKKTRRRYIFPAALIITALAIVWALHGDLTDFILKNGYMMFLYQLPLVCSIFFPLLSIVIASRLSDIEHKGNNLKQICTLSDKGKIFDAKLFYGLVITLSMVIIFWLSAIIYGKAVGFDGEIPIKLYLMFLLFIITPTTAIYIFQHSMSMIFKNQAIAFFVGILGEFAGLFSMFLPQLPWLRRSLIWGYYGALQFVGMFGWTKETRYDTVYYEVMDISWASFAVLILATAAIYIIGRKIFCKSEV